MSVADDNLNYLYLLDSIFLQPKAKANTVKDSIKTCKLVESSETWSDDPKFDLKIEDTQNGVIITKRETRTATT